MTLELAITSDTSAVTDVQATITNVSWRGLRCSIAIDGDPAGISVDLRTQPGNAQSSVASETKTFRQNGTASLVVENEDLEGAAVIVVVLNDAGELLAQTPTQIGGEV